MRVDEITAESGDIGGSVELALWPTVAEFHVRVGRCGTTDLQHFNPRTEGVSVALGACVVFAAHSEMVGTDVTNCGTAAKQAERPAATPRSIGLPHLAGWGIGQHAECHGGGGTMAFGGGGCC